MSVTTETLIQEVKSALVELYWSIKSLWLYTEHHPTAQEYIHKVAERVIHLTEEQPISLQLNEEHVFLGAIPLEKSSKPIKDFYRYLAKRRIHSLTFLPGVQEAE